MRSTLLLIGFYVSFVVLNPSSVFAQTASSTPDAYTLYQVEQLQGEQDFGDFVVGPGKFNVELEPGQSEEVLITVTNRSGERKRFDLTTEDMVGSDDTDQATVLLGDDRGPYTLKDYLSVPADSFFVEPGQRVRIPVTISLPLDAEAGGRYGSLLVQTASVDDGSGNSSAAIVSRIAVLFFVTTPGLTTQSGELVDFATIPDTVYFASGPINFGLLYENDGAVHVNPSGEIRITNMVGDEVGFIEIAPWFSLPQSMRLREVVWDRETLLGRYTATAYIDRGYGNIIDTKSISFWVVNWVLLLSAFIGLFVLFFCIRFIATRVEIKPKNN